MQMTSLQVFYLYNCDRLRDRWLPVPELFSGHCLELGNHAYNQY